MPNVLDDLMPKILARGMLQLRKQCIMPRLVNNDFSNDAAKKGATINVEVPATNSATDVTPANTPPAPTSQTADTVPIELDNWKHSDFHLTDKQVHEINTRENFLPSNVEAAVTALAEAVNGDILDEYKRVWGAVGTVGTIPFTTDITEALNVRQTLNDQLCPRPLRRFVLDSTTETKALALAPFRDMGQSGDNRPIIEGQLGRKLGFDFFSEDQIPTHTAGTGAGYQINNGPGYPAGTKTVTVDTGTGTLIVGDIIKFAGHSQTYVVTTALSGNSFSFEPGLKASVANDEVITKTATHVAMLAFHRNAIAFASRPLQSSEVDMELGNRMLSMVDPVSGLVMRLEVSRQYKQTVWDFDILWGCRLIQPELACRLIR